jgi:hypothetical protein
MREREILERGGRGKARGKRKRKSLPVRNWQALSRGRRAG